MILLLLLVVAFAWLLVGPALQAKEQAGGDDAGWVATLGFPLLIALCALAIAALTLK